MTALPLKIMEKFLAQRSGLDKVLHDGQHAWACDGYCLVRTPSSHPVSEDPLGMVAKYQNLLTPALPADESLLWSSETPKGEIKIRTCETCRGTGKASKCEECGGTGEVTLEHEWFDRHGVRHTTDYDVTCESCSGRGILRGGDDDCPDCDGAGKVEEDSPVAFGDHWIDAKRLKLLELLPGLQIHPNVHGNPVGALAIRGEGFVGIVMPTRNREG